MPYRANATAPTITPAQNDVDMLASWLERAYPTAMAFLDQAYAAGVRREDVRTFGGRTIPMGAAVVGIGTPGGNPFALQLTRGPSGPHRIYEGS